MKPVSTKTLIKFSNSTRVKKIENDDFIILMHKFELVDMGDLLKIAKSYNNAEQPEFGTGKTHVLIHVNASYHTLFNCEFINDSSF